MYERVRVAKGRMVERSNRRPCQAPYRQYPGSLDCRAAFHVTRGCGHCTTCRENENPLQPPETPLKSRGDLTPIDRLRNVAIIFDEFAAGVEVCPLHSDWKQSTRTPLSRDTIVVEMQEDHFTLPRVYSGSGESRLCKD